MYIYFFFFFQAEDGIRDGHVTGVQTCALPIFEEQEARSVSGERRHRARRQDHDQTDRGERGRRQRGGGQHPSSAPLRPGSDRKSTRLNSSHVASSYAVFCLKKKRQLGGAVKHA